MGTDDGHGGTFTPHQNPIAAPESYSRTKTLATDVGSSSPLLKPDASVQSTEGGGKTGLNTTRNALVEKDQICSVPFAQACVSNSLISWPSGKRCAEHPNRLAAPLIRLTAWWRSLFIRSHLEIAAMLRKSSRGERSDWRKGFFINLSSPLVVLTQSTESQRRREIGRDLK
ncbi:hypothetical protein BaRGS_00039617 [Batillaria attramentaria]|uniref:Uncharacterized protein n=1 Tax=Batillaria attramentaria TaxID=370345 RepID=A0ABD0J2X1_9CAEN